MEESLLKKKHQQRQFLDQLINGKTIDNYGVAVPIKADLRKYQQVSSDYQYSTLIT